MNNFFDNKSKLFGDDLKQTISKDSKVQVAASIFSIYGFKALEKELKKIDKLDFIFKDPTFIKREQNRKQEKQFEINRAKFEKAIGGTEYEVKLINEMNTKAIATECAKWIEKKAQFKTNNTKQNFTSSIFNVTNENNYAYLQTENFSSEGFEHQKDNRINYGMFKVEGDNSLNYTNKFVNPWSYEELTEVTSDVSGLDDFELATFLVIV